MRAYDRALRVALMVLITLPALALAQGTASSSGSAPANSTGGTAPTASTAPTPAPSQATAQPAQPGSATTSAPRPIATSTTPRPAATTTQGTPQSPRGAPTPPLAAPAGSAPTNIPTPVVIATGTADAVAESGMGAYAWEIAVGVLLAIIPFGFFAIAYFRKKKPSEEENTKNRCLDIENLMKDKLNELTDLKAMAQEKTVEMGKELMRDLVTGTKTGDLLVQIEKAEEQYLKLKQLFDECKVDIDRYKFKGVVIENSLIDKEVLKQVRVIRSRAVGELILHDIRLSAKQIETIQKNIVDTKWFFHLWEPGKDDVRVVFKDALFEIKNSDRSTWKDAIAHGLQCGIPESKLDFKIV